MPRDFDVPPALAARLEAWWADGAPVGAAPRAAATVVLVRAAPSGPGVEVFVMRRRTTMAFAAGMVVFPGGGVDPRDGVADVPWSGPDPTWWAATTGSHEEAARAVVCAAVRETFEECDVLLASAPEQLGTADVVDPQGWSDLARERLLARDVALSGLLAERDLVLRADLLLPLAHWTTPEFEPRRYDTWFLLARMPAGRVARDVSTEASAAGWASPQALLAASATGEVALMPPTRVVLEQLAAAPSVDALWDGVRSAPALDEVMPVPVREESGPVLRTALPAVDLPADAP